MKEQAIMKLYKKYPQLNCKVGEESVDESIFSKGPTLEWITHNVKDCDCCQRPKNLRLKRA